MAKPAVFRDPIHGIIRLDGAELAILGVLETRAVQRLRRVRQMGFASLVYPGAEHSRFGHALGALHVAGRVAAHLGLPPEVARDVRVAALLHDVGHGPFSHAWEEALGDASHEEWGRRIVTEDAELRAALGQVSPDLPAAVSGMFDKTYRPEYARKLVSSQLDVDRMDYLLRDAHYTGVRYSAYDLDWIIHALELRDGDVVIDWRRGTHAVEQYLAGRFFMYSQVYYHKTVRAAEAMLIAVMRRFAELVREGSEPPGLPTAGRLVRGEAVAVDDYLMLDDARLVTALLDWSRGADPLLADLCGRLVHRRLFKTIEAGEDPALEAALRPELEAAARARLGDRASYYFAIDNARRLSYDPRAGEEINVVGHPRHDTVDLGMLLARGSEDYPRFTLRVICAPELRDAFRPIVNAALAATARG